ncbi:MAG: T9SS type A sorting domain-containing protein [Ignavibacteriales bacterium]|nr:MAG: T9SS type A sorting domain-containing protein [Ignavibacteriales bacterium]
MVLSSHLFAQAWFPLDVGNKYQFLKKSFLQDDSSNAHWEYQLFYIDVFADTTIGDYQYYKTTIFPDTWIRHDCRDSKTYIYWDSKDHLMMNYALPVDTLFEHLDPATKTVKLVQSLVDTMFFAGDERIMRGYRTFETSPAGYTDLFISPDIGFFSFYHQQLNPGQDTTKIFYELINAKLVLNYFTENYTPQINHIPLSEFSDSVFHFSADVNHFYNKFFTVAGPDSGINYIDSVLLYTQYKRDDSILIAGSFSCFNVENSPEWIYDLPLETDLLNDGFVLQYYIRAVDKAIVPVTSAFPDTGYITLNYVPTAISYQTSNVSGFELMQNYPNPFNPSTEIEFHLPEEVQVQINVYDILGSKLDVLLDEIKSAGIYQLTFDGSDYSSGIYILQLRAGDYVSRLKMVLAK